jgi:hypothetical protein
MLTVSRMAAAESNRERLVKFGPRTNGTFFTVHYKDESAVELVPAAVEVLRLDA